MIVPSICLKSKSEKGGVKPKDPSPLFGGTMLLKYIKEDYKIISIVGMAKNSGKTVALNQLISEGLEAGMTLGLISTGRDGESEDVATETEKPKIFAPEGSFFATTTELLPLLDATVEIMEITNYSTPLGEILIGRVRDSGYIQIAGPQSLRETKRIAHKLLDLGAELVIIDGAIDRRSAAAPSIADATILSTGAVLSRDMNRLIEETIHISSLFNLPRLEEDRDLVQAHMERDEIAIIKQDGQSQVLDIKTAISAGSIIGEMLDEDSKYLILPGSLVKTTVENIISSSKYYKNIDIVVRDGTRIFIPPKDWLRFARYGLSIKVLNPIKLIAITLNPSAPQGYYFEPDILLEKMRYFIKDIPVLDVIYGGD